MNENLRSILVGTSALAAAALGSLLLTLTRRGFKSDSKTQDRLARLFLIGISLQCLHFIEEFITRFYQRFPRQLGVSAWSSEFFVAFNLFWIAVWGLSVIGIRQNFRAAFFATWFFIIAMVANGVAHPLLAVAVGGYFPGLWTSPLVVLVGVVLGSAFWKFTAR